MSNEIRSSTPRSETPATSLQRTPSNASSQTETVVKDTLSQVEIKPTTSQPSTPTLTALTSPAGQSPAPLTSRSESPIQPVEYEEPSTPTSTRAGFRELASAFFGGIRNACSALLTRAQILGGSFRDSTAKFFDVATLGPKRRANAAAKRQQRTQEVRDLHARAQAAIDKLGPITDNMEAAHWGSAGPSEAKRSLLAVAHERVAKLGGTYKEMEARHQGHANAAAKQAWDAEAEVAANSITSSVIDRAIWHDEADRTVKPMVANIMGRAVANAEAEAVAAQAEAPSPAPSRNPWHSRVFGALKRSFSRGE